MEARDRMIQIMAKLWRRIFPGQEITRTSNFFELGGTSLNAVLFSSSLDTTFIILHHETGIALGLDAIYQYPTLEELADAAVQ